MRDTVFDVPLALDIRIAVEFGGRPVDDYAVMLQVLEGEHWKTVFLVDNAHETHHAHRYTGEEKGPSEPFFDGADNQAVRNAVTHLRDNADTIIQDWKTRTAQADGQNPGN